MLNFRIFISLVLSIILLATTTNAVANSGSSAEIGEEIEIQSASGEHHARFPPSNVLDGDLSRLSIFASRANPDDLVLDLGDLWTVETINIAWALGTGRSYDFEIATRANESEEWSSVFLGQSSGTTVEFETYDVTASQAQFVRIRGLSNSLGNAWTFISEVKAYGIPVPAPIPQEIEIQSASGEHHARFPPSNVLDGDLSRLSIFASRANPDDLVLDLGDLWIVETINIAWGLGTGRSYDFEIATRANESEEWSSVFLGQSSGTTVDFETYDVTASQAQFVRIRGLSNSLGNAWTFISEVKAYGIPMFTPSEEITTLEHFGEPVTLVGANIPWSSDSGFSSDFGWFTPTDIEAYRNHFSRIQQAGGNSARVWLHTTAQVTPNIDASGTVLGLSNVSSDAVVIDQLKSVLDEAWGRGIVVTFSLFSFDMFCDSFGDDFGYNSFLDIERHQIMVEDNYQSYIDNALNPMVDGLKDHPGLFAYEVFNEAEGAIIDMTDAGHFCQNEPNVPGDGLSFPLSLAGAQRFVNRIAAAVHERDPNVKVTTATHTDFFEAFSNQTLTAQPDADQNGTLDFYELHHYPFYQNPPYITNVDIYEADRPIIIGEYDLADAQQESLFHVNDVDSLSAIIDQGYQGAWPWSLVNDEFGLIDEAISNVPASDNAIDRAAVEACIASRDSSCYRQ